LFLQRVEQVFTSSQQARHFLRHAKGRPQARQIFSGKCDLPRAPGFESFLRMT
jgi:hypothetical protein